MSIDAIEHLALIVGRAILALGPDVVAMAAAPDGDVRLAKLVRLGIAADREALEVARHEVDTVVERLPHRDGSNPEGGR